MATYVQIDDPADPRLDDFRDLTLADRRPDRPGGRGIVVAEGVPVVQRLLASAYPIRRVMGIPAKVAALAPDLDGVGIPVYAVPAAVMDAVVGFHLNRGVLATADRASRPSIDELARSTRLLAVLEGVNDHENLGALFRNAASLGVDGVVLGPRSADPLYRRSVRVSMGHVLRVPFAPAEGWPETLEFLQHKGFVVAALTAKMPATPIHELRADKVAVLLGAEGPGLTDRALAAADVRVRIPMRSGVDSLNVATAAAIAFHRLGIALG
ncbi:MAG: TrmH family RNA methyltransferase [Mycobacteriales bacterium]